jgi:hypothetical protein
MNCSLFGRKVKSLPAINDARKILRSLGGPLNGKYPICSFCIGCQRRRGLGTEQGAVVCRSLPASVRWVGGFFREKTGFFFEKPLMIQKKNGPDVNVQSGG